MLTADLAPPRVSATGDQSLGRLMLELRRGMHSQPTAPKFDIFRTVVKGRSFVQVWFRTRGCTWHLRGECTTCNYGVGPREPWTATVDAVAEALAQVGPCDELFVSPSGSLLDPLEVDRRALVAILKLIAAAPASTASFETRSETISYEVLDTVATELAGKQVFVGTGLESSNELVRARCLNRSDTVVSHFEAYELIARFGLSSYANVTLGAPFLTRAESMADALRTVADSRSAGATIPIVFPMNVKSHTLLEVLLLEGRYEPPRLRDLALVLARSGVDTESAWFEPTDPRDPSVIVTPHACTGCEDVALSAIRAHRASGKPDELHRLLERSCDCAVEPEWGPDIAARIDAEIDRLRQRMPVRAAAPWTVAAQA